MKPLFNRVKVEAREETMAKVLEVLAQVKEPPLSYYAGFFLGSIQNSDCRVR